MPGTTGSASKPDSCAITAMTAHDRLTCRPASCSRPARWRSPRPTRRARGSARGSARLSRRHRERRPPARPTPASAADGRPDTRTTAPTGQPAARCASPRSRGQVLRHCKSTPRSASSALTCSGRLLSLKGCHALTESFRPSPCRRIGDYATGPERSTSPGQPRNLLANGAYPQAPPSPEPTPPPRAARSLPTRGPATRWRSRHGRGALRCQGRKGTAGHRGRRARRSTSLWRRDRIWPA